MEGLIDSLQRHPVVIIVMFILTVLSASITIYLGWAKFYTAFLSKRAEAAYLVCSGIGIGIGCHCSLYS